MKSARCIDRRDRGYVLLVLLLLMAMMSFGFLVILEKMEFQIKRDREEEFIHRGVEYSRAVRRYVKQFGRYPTSLEALEHTNNIRFLRKRYRDPIANREFKVIYYGDLETFYHNPLAAAANRSSQKSALLVAQPPASTELAIVSNEPRISEEAATAIDTNPASPADAGSVTETDPAAEENQEAATDASPEKTGGRTIVGVSSYSKRETIRIFNRKNHYDEWQFVYDPTTDMGLMKAPNQPIKSKGQAPSSEETRPPISDSAMNRPQQGRNEPFRSRCSSTSHVEPGCN